MTKANTSTENIPGLWTGQGFHFLSLSFLLAITFWAWDKTGQPFPVLFWSSIAVPILHQIYVWLAWRLELKSHTITRSIGFKPYLVIFFIFLISRGIFIFELSLEDCGSLGLPNFVRIFLSCSMAIICLYTVYSIKKYFGFVRAAGADHFDENYRKMPLVKKGIFQYTNNGMYTVGFLVLWLFAIWFDSQAGIIVAAFSHIYIWVHYFATEKPDMRYIYGVKS